MTQDEVDLIYDYLHENYEYKNKGLIALKTIGSRKKNHSLGTFKYSDTQSCLFTVIKIDGLKYNIPVSHAIYIYHHKIKPICVEFLDGNSMNLDIKNIVSSDRKKVVQKKIGRGFTVHKYKRGIVYQAKIYTHDKVKYLGTFNTPEEAHEAYLKAKEQYANEKNT